MLALLYLKEKYIEKIINKLNEKFSRFDSIIY